MNERKLTDADVKAIVAELRREVTSTFYEDLGRGLWAAVVKVVIAALVGIAAYTQVKGWRL